MKRGFTLIELMVVVAIIGVMAAVVLATLTDVQKDAHDKRRRADLDAVRKALELYYTDHQYYPKESAGMNGDIAQNVTFQTAVGAYLSGGKAPFDPLGRGDPTYYYYYDGKASCGGVYKAVLFARQMEKSQNANYTDYVTTTCGGIVDGEGRGGGSQSWNILLGESGG